MTLLDLIPGVTTLRNICIGICVTAACTSFAGLYGYHKGKVKAEAIAAQKALAIASQRETEARVASENYRRLEADLRGKLDTAQRNYETLQSQHAPVLAALAATRADNSRMRNELSSYASRGSPAEDSVAACRERAETLSGLLAGALQADGEHAAEAELNADALRTVLAAWPSP